MDEDSFGDLGRLLTQVWIQQHDYNAKVKALQTDKPDWVSIYLLGMIGEVDEVLKEMQWKRHRLQDSKAAGLIRENVLEELVDVFKYNLSLFQEFGFSAEDILAATHSKGLQLEYQLQSEYFPISGRRFVVTDLDGTGADYRKGWENWSGIPDRVNTLNVDLDNGIPFEEYQRRKTEFEAAGGYATLPVYTDWAILLNAERLRGTGLMVTTARPANEIRRIWKDTQSWLARYGIAPDSIVFGRDERIVELLKMGERENDVVLLEDDATLALRAAQNGIHVMLRDQPYNRGVQHDLVQRFTTYPKQVPWEEYFPNSVLRMEVPA